MEEIKIYQKRRKIVRSFIVGVYTVLLWLLFLGLGIYDSNIILICFVSIGLLVTVYCCIVIAHHLIKPKAILTVNEHGITDETTIPSIGKIDWEEIDSIYKAKVLKKTSIYIKLKDTNQLYSSLPKWKALFIRLNTPKSADPIVINLQKSDANISEVLDLLKTGLKDYRNTLQ